MKVFNSTSVILGIAGGIIVRLFGGFDLLLKALTVLVVLDYITGVIKAIYNKKLSSDTGFKGLLKKVIIFIVVITSVVIEELLGGSIPLREMTIMFFACNEGISLLENAGEFIPLPLKLKETLIQLREG